MGAFFVSFLLAVFWIKSARPKLLILHSYSPSYVWTREIDVGLERILEKESLIDTRYHYMETKKKSGKDFLRRAGIAARKAVENFRPDVLIAIDDNAQKLAAIHYIDDQEIKIVFAGVNGCGESYGYKEASNVTGILECKPLGAVEDVIEMILPKEVTGALIKGRFISDVSVSASRDAEYLSKRQWKSIDLLQHVGFETFDSWKEFVIDEAETADFLLVGAYRKMYRNKDHKAKGEKFVESTEVATWTEANSPVPVIGINDFNASDGIMLSVGSSPYEQGETAAEFAMKILRDDISPKEIPFRASNQYLVALRKSAMERRNIHVPDILEAFARATENYFE